MDNLTHSLVGVCLARAGLNRLTPQATAILLIAANAPDIDVVSGLAGPSALLHWHRNWTHSLALSVVLAIAAVVLVRLFTRRIGKWMPAVLAAWVGVLSHLLLDLTNNYGVRLFQPFSSRWVEWDLCYVVDPYIWGALLLAVFAPLLGKLLSSEMGGRPRAYPARAWAVFALGFILLYDGARLVLHDRAVATLDARLYGGEATRRVAAFPVPLTPLKWQALAETSDRYYLSTLDLNAEFDPASGRVLFKNDPGQAVGLLRRQKSFGALIEFAQYPLWRVVDDENNALYRLTALRFGDPAAQTFTCTARLLGPQRVGDEHCDFSFASSFDAQ